MEEVNKPTSAEQVGQLEADMARAKRLKITIDSEGWPIIAGYLRGLKTNAFSQLIEEIDPLKISYYQQTYKVVDAIENYIKNTIQMGDAARKQLFPVERDGSTGKTANVQQQS